MHLEGQGKRLGLVRRRNVFRLWLEGKTLTLMQEVIWIKRPEFSDESSLVLHTYGSFVQQSRDAEDVAVTDVRYGAFDDALAAF